MSETEFLDKPMCLRVAALARFSVPAVVFLLGGLAASEIHHWVNSEHRKDTCDGACWSHEDPTVGSCRPNQNNGKWFIVDELDAGCDGDLEGNVLDRGWNLEEAGTVLGEPEVDLPYPCQTSDCLCHRSKRELSLSIRTLNAEPDPSCRTFCV